MGQQRNGELIALNESQNEAVKGILKSKPITVIKGPPGCGKSQVVLSLLLNAWQHGISVLFASNNNQAVDVVRKRLEPFENSFPLAVRAGNSRNNNIKQTLEDTLNNIPSQNEFASDKLFEKLLELNSKREKLIETRIKAEKFLQSKLPQRIDEAVRSAITAYAKFQKTLLELNQEKEFIIQKFNSFGFDINPEHFEEKIVKPFESWLKRIPIYQKIFVTDEQSKEQLFTKKELAYGTRNLAALKIGLNYTENQSWNWINENKGPELIIDWRNRFTDFINQPHEENLKHFDWKEEFYFWTDELVAKDWYLKAEELMSDILDEFNRITPMIKNRDSLKDKYFDHLNSIKELGVSPEKNIDLSIIDQWNLNYSIILSLPDSFVNHLPLSTYQSAKSKLKEAESKFRQTIISPIFWQKVGVLDSNGRSHLSELLQKLIAWFSIKDEWANSQSARDEIDLTVNNLQRRFNGLFPKNKAQAFANPIIWQSSTESLKINISLARNAENAWISLKKKNFTITNLHSLSNEFLLIDAGVPIKEAWLKEQGAKFNRILEKLNNDPAPIDIINARTVLYTNSLYDLIESWTVAREAEKSIKNLQNDINTIPSRQKRVDQWKDECPENLFLLFDLSNIKTEFPDSET